MKKLLLSLILIVSSVSYAQITYGAKAGLNMSNITNVHSDSGSRNGLHIGGFVTIPLGQNYQYYIQPEILYSQQGEKNDGINSTTQEGYEEVYQLDYINIPVLFKPYFSEEDTEFFGVFGPQFGFLISDEVKDQVVTVYSDDEYSSFDFGLVGGIGFSYLRTWEVDLRYFYGLSDVVDEISKDRKNRTSNLHFSLGYRF